MNYLSNIVVLVVMVFGLVHCGKLKKERSRHKAGTNKVVIVEKKVKAKTTPETATEVEVTKTEKKAEAKAEIAKTEKAVEATKTETAKTETAVEIVTTEAAKTEKEVESKVETVEETTTKEAVVKTAIESFMLVNNTGDDEDVRFSFDGSTEEGILIEPDQCVLFRAEDLPFLTVWAGAGMFESGSIKVLCGGDVPCTTGSYEVTDTMWTVFDSYNMSELEELEELDEDLECISIL